MASGGRPSLTWQRGEADTSLRSHMIQSIANLIVQNNRQPDEQFLSRVPTLAQKIEEKLYRSAASEYDYNDPDSLWDRIQYTINESRRSTQAPSGQMASGPGMGQGIPPSAQGQGISHQYRGDVNRGTSAGQHGSIPYGMDQQQQQQQQHSQGMIYSNSGQQQSSQQAPPARVSRGKEPVTANPAGSSAMPQGRSRAQPQQMARQPLSNQQQQVSQQQQQQAQTYYGSQSYPLAHGGPIQQQQPNPSPPSASHPGHPQNVQQAYQQSHSHPPQSRQIQQSSQLQHNRSWTPGTSSWQPNGSTGDSGTLQTQMSSATSDLLLPPLSPSEGLFSPLPTGTSQGGQFISAFDFSSVDYPGEPSSATSQSPMVGPIRGDQQYTQSQQIGHSHQQQTGHSHQQQTAHSYPQQASHSHSQQQPQQQRHSSKGPVTNAYGVSQKGQESTSSRPAPLDPRHYGGQINGNPDTTLPAFKQQQQQSQQKQSSMGHMAGYAPPISHSFASSDPTGGYQQSTHSAVATSRGQLPRYEPYPIPSRPISQGGYESGQVAGGTPTASSADSQFFSGGYNTTTGALDIASGGGRPEQLHHQQPQQQQRQYQVQASQQQQREMPPLNAYTQQQAHHGPGNSSEPPGPPNATAGTRQEREVMMHEQQQRLLLLRHASKCQIRSGVCPFSPECLEMQHLWQHLKECKNANCSVLHCATIRYFISHYNECKDQRCEICRPIRESINRNTDTLVTKYLSHIKSLKVSKSALEAKKESLEKARSEVTRWQRDEAHARAQIKRLEGIPDTEASQMAALRFEQFKTSLKAAKLTVQAIEAEIAAEELIRKRHIEMEAKLKVELRVVCGGEQQANIVLRQAVEKHNAHSARLQQEQARAHGAHKQLNGDGGGISEHIGSGQFQQQSSWTGQQQQYGKAPQAGMPSQQRSHQVSTMSGSVPHSASPMMSSARLSPTNSHSQYQQPPPPGGNFVMPPPPPGMGGMMMDPSRAKQPMPLPPLGQQPPPPVPSTAGVATGGKGRGGKRASGKASGAPAKEPLPSGGVPPPPAPLPPFHANHPPAPPGTHESEMHYSMPPPFPSSSTGAAPSVGTGKGRGKKPPPPVLSSPAPPPPGSIMIPPPPPSSSLSQSTTPQARGRLAQQSQAGGSLIPHHTSAGVTDHSMQQQHQYMIQPQQHQARYSAARPAGTYNQPAVAPTSGPSSISSSGGLPAHQSRGLPQSSPTSRGVTPGYVADVSMQLARSSSGLSVRQRSLTPQEIERNRRPPEITRALLDNSYLLWMDREDIESHIRSLYRYKPKSSGSGNSALARNFDPTKNFKQIAMQLLKLLLDQQHSHIFKTRVDPIALGLPDYMERIKHPMDLGTIKQRLDSKTNPYKSLSEFVSDVRLTFNNAVEYNGETSEVGAVALEYGQLFEREYALFREKEDEAAENSRFSHDCCRLCAQGGEFVFEPPIYYCEGACDGARIKRDSTMFVNGEHRLCKACYRAVAGETVKIGTEKFPKSSFKKVKNSEESKEEWIVCQYCRRRYHAICALVKTPVVRGLEHLCPFCLLRNLDDTKHSRAVDVLNIRVLRNQQQAINTSLGAPTPQLSLSKPSIREPKRTASQLPETEMSKFLQEKVNERVRNMRKGLSVDQNCLEGDVVKPGELTVRIVLNKHEELITRETMINLYGGEPYNYPKSFPHKQKCILLFEKIDGVDVLLFVMFLQLYGSDAPEPNKRSLYIAYLDSVNYFSPGQLRTGVYHELLIATLEHEKRNGYTRCFIWACPPTGGDDYIFNIHPRDQRVPEAPKLRNWYFDLLEEARKRGIVQSLNNLFDEYFARVPYVTKVPYFEGDWWQAYGELYIKALNDKKTNPLALQSLTDAMKNLGGIKSTRYVLEGSRARRRKAKKGIEAELTGQRNLAGADSKYPDHISCPPPRLLEQVPLQDMLTAKLAVENEKMKREFIVVKMFDECAECGTPMDIPGAVYWIPCKYDPLMDTHFYAERSYAPPYALCHGCYVVTYEAELGRAFDSATFELPMFPPPEWANVKAESDDASSSSNGDLAAQIESLQNASGSPEEGGNGSGGGCSNVPDAATKSTVEGGVDEVQIGNEASVANTCSNEVPDATSPRSAEGAPTTKADEVIEGNGTPFADEVDSDVEDSPDRHARSNRELVTGSAAYEDDDASDPKRQKMLIEDDASSVESSTGGAGETTIRSDSKGETPKMNTNSSPVLEVDAGETEAGKETSIDEKSTEVDSTKSPLSPRAKFNSRLLTRTQRRATDNNKMVEELLESNTPGDPEVEIEVLQPGVTARPPNPYMRQPCSVLNMKCVRAMIRPRTVDRDGDMECSVFDSRRHFLAACQKRHLQFDELRRAKYSTSVILDLLHNEPDGMQSAISVCKCCGIDLPTEKVVCRTCVHYVVCLSCARYYPHNQPTHQVEAIGKSQQFNEAATAQQARAPMSNQDRVRLNLAVLHHAAHCRGCSNEYCDRMRGLMHHVISCRQKATCDQCGRYFAVLNYHVRTCRDEACRIPECARIKAEMRRQQMSSTDRRILAMKRARDDLQQQQQQQEQSRAASVGVGASPVPFGVMPPLSTPAIADHLVTTASTMPS